MDGDPEHAATLVVGLLVIVLSTASVLLARSRRRQLREPTMEQLEDIAAPIGRILARHVPEAALSEDLVDAIAAAGSTSRWVKAGPLTQTIPETVFTKE